jgi:DNA-binding Lrp family transcriptional regulator
MPIKPDYKDETRLKLLKALRVKGSIKPDLKTIHEQTGLSIVTIKRALKTMEEKNHIDKFYPVISARKTGFEILAMIFLQVDTSKEKKLDEFLDFCKKEPRIISVHRVIGSGKWNLMIRSISRSLEQFDIMITNPHVNIQGNSELILDSLFFFTTSPVIKSNKRAKTLVNIFIDAAKKNPSIGKDLTPKRKKLMKCFGEENALKPNVKQLQKLTKLHASTIKSSLHFLEEEGILTGFAPSMNFEKIGLRNLVFDFYKIDFSDEEGLNTLKKILDEDQNMFHAGSVFGDGDHNFLIMQAYATVEDYQNGFRTKYGPGNSLSNFLQNRMTFFATSSPIESKGLWPSRSTAILDLLLYEAGMN